MADSKEFSLTFGPEPVYYQTLKWWSGGIFNQRLYLKFSKRILIEREKMDLWLETLGVIFAAILGVFFGKMFSRLGQPYWLCGYFLPLLLIAVFVMTRYSAALGFLPPFSWVADGRARFIILSLLITMGLTTPLSRLPHRYEKFIVSGLMVVFIASFSFSFLIVPALLKNHLSNLKTRVDSNGICYQSRDYTCGPAAAVTALRRLGLQAQEGEIAVLSHTSPLTGTLPHRLYAALQNQYGDEGLKCRYRHFDSILQLKDAGITLAVIKNAFLLDHCVAVLEVSDRMVLIADPVLGERRISHEQFERTWRFCGIVLKRDSA